MSRATSSCQNRKCRRWKKRREQRIEEVFLALLRKMNDQHRPVSPSPNANNYAPAVFAEMADSKAYNKKDYTGVMERLLDRKITHVGTYGRPSKPQRFLVAEPPQT
jgi:hypothetical protein